MVPPITQLPLPAQSYGADWPADHAPDSPVFNGRGASLAPPPRQYMAQPTPSNHATVHMDQPPGVPGNVQPVDPTISVKGSPEVAQPPKTEESKKTKEDFTALNTNELLYRGKQQLDEAEKAYTAFGEKNIALTARNALEAFAECAMALKGSASVGWYQSPDKLLNALRKIELPPDAPKDLTVTITFPPPNHEAISLIPLGAGLENKKPMEIYHYYVHALGAMKNQARELNADQGLAQAEAKLNDILETLKAIQKEINERKQRNPQEPYRSSDVQFESRYYAHVDKGITITRLANGQEFPFHEATIKGKVSDPTKPPEEPPAPTLTPTPEEA